MIPDLQFLELFSSELRLIIKSVRYKCQKPENVKQELESRATYRIII